MHLRTDKHRPILNIAFQFLAKSNDSETISLKSLVLLSLFIVMLLSMGLPSVPGLIIIIASMQFSEHKYEIVKILQEKKHIVGMTGDGVNDAPALKKADIGIAVADATDAARSASDIVLTEPGLSVIISAVLTSRAIFQRMKNYTVQF